MTIVSTVDPDNLKVAVPQFIDDEKWDYFPAHRDQLIANFGDRDAQEDDALREYAQDLADASSEFRSLDKTTQGILMLAMDLYREHKFNQSTLYHEP